MVYFVLAILFHANWEKRKKAYLGKSAILHLFSSSLNGFSRETCKWRYLKLRHMTFKDDLQRGAWSPTRRMMFKEAASLPLAAVTALWALHRCPGLVESETVFIPATRRFILGKERPSPAIANWSIRVSGTVAYACQLAWYVFKTSIGHHDHVPCQVSKVAELESTEKSRIELLTWLRHETRLFSPDIFQPICLGFDYFTAHGLYTVTP